jgi:hypothetical protein
MSEASPAETPGSKICVEGYLEPWHHHEKRRVTLNSATPHEQAGDRTIYHCLDGKHSVVVPFVQTKE